jgi:surfeit locus 1 family protein
MSPTPRRLTMALLLLAAAGFVRLGVWQLDRLHQRRAANTETMAARRAPPVTLAPGTTGAESLAERRVVAEGRYDQARDVIIRGEAYQGSPGVFVVTPLLLGAKGPAVLVPDAVTVNLEGLQEPGEVTVRGIARPMPSGSGAPIEHGGRTTWRRLDLAALRARLPYELLPIYIQQIPDSSLPRFPRRVAPAPIDEGPHLSYAIQWFLFAGMAGAFAVLVVGRRSGER